VATFITYRALQNELAQSPTIAPLALEFKILVNPDFNCFSLFACGLPRHSGIATK
jgi:hypothetical protein